MLVKHLLENEPEEDTEDDVYDALDRIESRLGHESRFKYIKVDVEDRIVYWVTQEMDRPRDLLRLAERIAEALLEEGCGLWTVKTCVRDEFRGYSIDTDWEVYEAL